MLVANRAPDGELFGYGIPKRIADEYLKFPELSVDQLKRMAEAAHRLARNPEFLFTVLGNRPEISTDAVKGSALDGDLGFEPDCKFGALYPLFVWNKGAMVHGSSR